MPFLYTGGDGEAWLVNGRSQVAGTVHGALNASPTYWEFLPSKRLGPA